MKTYRYVEPSATYAGAFDEITMTEDEILREYFPSWSERMRKVGKQGEISFKNCIDDWVTIHWAQEVK